MPRELTDCSFSLCFYSVFTADIFLPRAGKFFELKTEPDLHRFYFVEPAQANKLKKIDTFSFKLDHDTNV